MRPRRPSVSRWIRRRHWSSASPDSLATWNGSITVTASGSSWLAAVLNPVKPSIATTSAPSRQARGRAASQVLNTLLERPRYHVQQPRGTCLVTYRSEIDDDGDEPATAPGVAPDVLVDADDLHAVEPARVIDQHALAFGQDRIIGRVPGHPQTCGDARGGEVVDYQCFQRPPHPATGQPRPLHCCSGEVLAPGAPAPTALVAAHAHQQHGRAVPKRLMRELSRARPTRQPPPAAPPSPGTWLSNPALDHRPLRAQTLADDHKTELVKTAEHLQVRGCEGGIEHVEVFQMDSAGTSTNGRPQPSPRHQHAQPTTPSTAKSRITSRMITNSSQERRSEARVA